MLKISYAFTGAMTADEFESLLPYVSEERRLFLTGCKSIKYRNSSLVGEILARRMLAEETGLKPEQIIIGKTVKGKPFAKNVKDWYFNISHSDHYVMCAVSDHDVGVDLQKIVEFKPELEKQILAPAEAEEYRRLTGAERELYLTRIWCRKESYYKYLGTGIDRRPRETDSIELAGQGSIEWFEGQITEQMLYSVCGNKRETLSPATIKESKIFTPA